MNENSKKTILLVEDEALLAINEKMQLEKYGYSVHHVTTGEKAVQTIVDGTHPVDLILMDINLGSGIDGTQAAEKILNQKDIPVVFLSSHTEPEVVEKTEKITSYGYVVKNSTITVLDASIKMAFKLFEANRKTIEELRQRKLLETALERRLIALTRPLDQTEQVSFFDLFDITAIQRIQDQFSKATNVASVITLPDGTPITEPSNFTYLCSEIIRKNKKGCSNCFKSDAELGKMNEEGPIIQPCLSGGLWDAGASITVGSQHIANWLIGQVRDETQTEEGILRYAREIEADETEVLEAFRDVPSMKLDQFTAIAHALFSFAKQLSDIAYQNVQQARFITELRKAEVENRLLADIVRRSKDFIGVADPEGSAFYVNPAGQAMVGLEGENEAVRTKIQDYFFPEDLETLEKTIIPTVLKEGQWSGEFRFCHFRTGKPVYVHYDLFQTQDSSTEEIRNLATISRDITERKLADEELQASERRTRLQRTTLAELAVNQLFVEADITLAFQHIAKTVTETLDVSRASIWALNEDGLKLHCLALYEREIDTFSSGTELTASDLPRYFKAIMEENRICAEDAQNDPRTSALTESYLKPLGITSMLDSGTIIDGQLVGVICSEHIGPKRRWHPDEESFVSAIAAMASQLLMNVKRKNAEQKIQQQLAEKETLLKEVHHRIKNNMAQVESLLSLQAASTENAEVKSALYEAMSRVRSIRELYEKLLIGKSYEGISTKDYLGSLIDSVAEVFNDRPGVTIEKKIVDLTLSPKKAIPIGITVNELLTNVFKYAFNGRDSGHVSVELTKTETRVTLTISDDGIGIDERADANSSPGFGLTIVNMLAEQLDGTFSIESNHGTRSIVEFEL